MSAGTVWVEEHFVAGDLALDLANTVYRRWPEPGPDLLTDPETLDAWFVRAGLVPEGDGTVDAGVLEDARMLRSHLWTAFDAQREGRTTPTDTLGALLGVARDAATDVEVGADGGLASRDAGGALGVLALSAVALVLQPPAQGVRACDRCGWFFIDSSRGRRRRWCSMRTCGNQAKADRFRATRS